MSNTFFKQNSVAVQSSGLFTAQVFGWMTFGVIVTALVALVINIIAAQSVALYQLVYVFSFPAIIIQLVLVLVLSFLWRKLNGVLAAIIFLAYSAFTGILVGIISLDYNVGSLFVAFGISGVMFLILAVYGLLTKSDLSRWRAFALFAVLGIILVSIVNFFLYFINPALFNGVSLLLNYVIVVVFSILIAADSSKLKELAYEAETTGMGYTRYAISGALMLYLDFINLFLSVLRITGKRR